LTGRHRVPQPCRAYGLRVPVSCVLHAPAAQALCPVGHYCTCAPGVLFVWYAWGWHAYRNAWGYYAYRGTLGGSKDAAEELLVEVLAELKTMETADWGLMDTQETQPAAGDTKFYSGLWARRIDACIWYILWNWKSCWRKSCWSRLWVTTLWCGDVWCNIVDSLCWWVCDECERVWTQKGESHGDWLNELESHQCHTLHYLSLWDTNTELRNEQRL